jgi:hypothetical protein
VRKKLQFPTGIIGLVFGVLAASAEGLALLGVSEEARAACFRTLFALSAILLLSAILITVDRLTRVIEEQPTRVQPVIDAFMAGVSMRDTPAGKRVRGHSGTPFRLVEPTSELHPVPTPYPQHGSSIDQ